MINAHRKWWNVINKNLIRKGPNSSSIPELIDNLSKAYQPVIGCYIVFYQNPKFEVCRFDNDKNTRLRQTDGKPKNSHLEYWLHFEWKCLLKQVQNGFICWIQLRNGWEPKEKNSGWWRHRHLHLIRHFEILKKKIFYDIFFYRKFYLIQSFNWFAIKLS
jgi:hypothetical protein